MRFFYLKIFTLSILCSVFVHNIHTHKSYNAQQRAESIARKFVWPEGQLPKLKVTYSDKTEFARCIWNYFIPYFFEIHLNKEFFNDQTSKAKDFILAHEIAHYHLSTTNYLPQYIVDNFVTVYVLYSLSFIKNIFGFIVGLYIKCSILIPKLFLQRLTEYEADKQAALVLKDTTSFFKRFKPIIPPHKKTAFMKLAEIIDLLFRTHPYDEQRKQALEQLKI